MKVAMLAPPWIPVPPPGYGGIEQVIALLAAELTERGNEVTLFAAPGTRSEADVLSPLEGPHPDEIQMSLYEADHVASAFARMDEAEAAVRRPARPLRLHRLRVRRPDRHPRDPHAARPVHRDHVGLLRASRAQGARRRAQPVPGRSGAVPAGGRGRDRQPHRRRRLPLPGGEGRLPALDRPLQRGQGPEPRDRRRAGGRRAARARRARSSRARRSSSPARSSRISTRTGSATSARWARRRRELYAGASALLMPIRWPEPFGLVMTEAMACGTPVIAFPEGSAPEIVLDGETGFVVDDEHEMAARGGPARRDRPGALPRQRARALRRVRRRRGVRERLRDRRARLTHMLTPSSKRVTVLGPWRTSTARAAG